MEHCSKTVPERPEKMGVAKRNVSPRTSSPRQLSRDEQCIPRILIAVVLLPVALYLFPSSASQISYLLAAAAAQSRRPPCGRLTPVTLSKPVHSFAGPNYREATRVTVGPFRGAGFNTPGFDAGVSLKFTVYRATGREFAVAPHAALATPALRRCIAYTSRRALAALRPDVSLLLAGAQRPEPVWTEDALPAALRLPHAREFTPYGSAGLGKLYLDEHPAEVTAATGADAGTSMHAADDEEAANAALQEFGGAADASSPRPGGLLPWRPTLDGAGLLGWVSVASRLHGGGAHQCWGGDRGCGGFACGLHRTVHLAPPPATCGSWWGAAATTPSAASAPYAAPPAQRRCGEPTAACAAAVYYDVVLIGAGGLAGAGAGAAAAAAAGALRVLRADGVLLVADWRVLATAPAARVALLRVFELLGRSGGLAVLAPRADATAADATAVSALLATKGPAESRPAAAGR